MDRHDKGKFCLQKAVLQVPLGKKRNKFVKLGFFPSSGETVGENEQTVLGSTETATPDHNL